MHLPHLVGRWLLPVLIVAAMTGCNPKYVKLTRQGDALLRKEDPEGARKRYEAALKKNPKYPPALDKLGLLSLDDGDWQKAETYYSAALAADPQYGTSYRGRGEARFHLGQLDPAGSDYRKAKDLNTPRADFGVGLYAYLKGDYEAAFMSLAEALKSEDDYEDAADIIFKTSIASKDYKTGLKLLEQVKLPEDEPEVASLIHRMRVDLFYLEHDYTGAQRALEKVEDKLSFGLWYREPSGLVKKRLGSQSGAIVEYLHLGSPAATAGIQPADVIVSFERKPIRSADDLDEAISAYQEKVHHEEALIEVLRGDQQLAFRVMPGQFRTRTLIDQAGSGGEAVALGQASDELMEFP